MLQILKLLVCISRLDRNSDSILHNGIGKLKNQTLNTSDIYIEITIYRFFNATKFCFQIVSVFFKTELTYFKAKWRALIYLTYYLRVNFSSFRLEVLIWLAESAIIKWEPYVCHYSAINRHGGHIMATPSRNSVKNFYMRSFYGNSLENSFISS